ncbi:PepSY domain-containing protein [Imhoffiella purpurea]|nr:PepSY domain-containing protein [Imhoffiella purpurea]
MKVPSLVRRRLICGFLVLAFCLPAQAGRHGRHWDEEDGHDHERARHALRRGEVRPIAEIIDSVAAQVPGELVEVEFERTHGHGPPRWLYELKIIAPDGRLLEVLVDGATAEVLKVEED